GRMHAIQQELANDRGDIDRRRPQKDSAPPEFDEIYVRIVGRALQNAQFVADFTSPARERRDLLLDAIVAAVSIDFVLTDFREERERRLDHVQCARELGGGLAGLAERFRSRPHAFLRLDTSAAAM